MLQALSMLEDMSYQRAMSFYWDQGYKREMCRKLNMYFVLCIVISVLVNVKCNMGEYRIRDMYLMQCDSGLVNVKCNMGEYKIMEMYLMYCVVI